MRSSRFFGRAMLSLATMAVVFCGFVSTAQGELLVYEGFGYPADVTSGSLYGSGGAELGFATGSTWQLTTGAGADNATRLDASSGPTVGVPWDGLVDNLLSSGNFAGVPDADDHTQASRTIAASVTGTFADDTSTWMSYVAAGSRYRARAVAGIGNGVIQEDRGKQSDGDVLGGGSVYNSDSLRAQYWINDGGGDGGNDFRSAAVGPDSTLPRDDASSVPVVVVMKFDWGASSDTVSMARFLETETLDETTFSSRASSITTSVNFDQSTFDQLSFAGSRYSIDEIRLGTTFADVTPIPEPGTFVLLAMGLLGLGLFARRKRRA